MHSAPHSPVSGVSTGTDYPAEPGCTKDSGLHARLAEAQKPGTQAAANSNGNDGGYGHPEVRQRILGPMRMQEEAAQHRHYTVMREEVSRKNNSKEAEELSKRAYKGREYGTGE